MVRKFIVVGASVASLMLSVAAIAQTQTFTAHPSTQEPNRLVTLETLKKWESELSNWGRWGTLAARSRRLRHVLLGSYPKKLNGF